MCAGQSRGCALRWYKHLLHKWMGPCPLSASKQIPSAGRRCHTGVGMQAATLPKQIPGFSYILLEKRGAKPGLREIDLQQPVPTFSFAL